MVQTKSDKLVNRIQQYTGLCVCAVVCDYWICLLSTFLFSKYTYIPYTHINCKGFVVLLDRCHFGFGLSTMPAETAAGNKSTLTHCDICNVQIVYVCNAQQWWDEANYFIFDFYFSFAYFQTYRTTKFKV